MNILELFAGVGGFRNGLENADKDYFQTKWANQWEPSRKSQDAFEVYDLHFPDSENINISISEISDEKFAEMNPEMIVGGFPCQGFSVANTRRSMKDERNFLYKEMLRVIKDKNPKFFVAENVKGILSMEKGKVIEMIKEGNKELVFKKEEISIFEKLKNIEL